ncbi:MAG TPA: hypothetical protein VJC14_00070 [Candidatus Paceibacterota bacterium]
MTKKGILIILLLLGLLVLGNFWYAYLNGKTDAPQDFSEETP